MARTHALSRHALCLLAALVMVACSDEGGAAMVDEEGFRDADLNEGESASADSSLAEPDPETDAGADSEGDAGEGGPDLTSLPYARTVSRFTAGAYAGFGARNFPDVVLGPPQGGGTVAGSLDVLSLGVGGEIVLDLGEGGIVDGEGPDFIVFENPFWPGEQAASVFAEPAEVAVSNDDVTWSVFPCEPASASMGRYPGCAGWTPTLQYDPSAVVPLDPTLTGGDAFDLATLSISRARYVRIRDLSTKGEGNTAGFDLDALGVIHTGP